MATTCGELVGFAIPAIVGATATRADVGKGDRRRCSRRLDHPDATEHVRPPAPRALASRVVANALVWIAGLAVVFAAIGIALGDSPILVAAFGPAVSEG